MGPESEAAQRGAFLTDVPLSTGHLGEHLEAGRVPHSPSSHSPLPSCRARRYAWHCLQGIQESCFLAVILGRVPNSGLCLCNT